MFMYNRVLASNIEDAMFISFNISKTPKDKLTRDALGSTDWLIRFDNTDHFQFYCPDCKEQALVEEVWIFLGHEVEGRIHFRLYCPKCGRGGQRKININLPNDYLHRQKKQKYL